MKNLFLTIKIIPIAMVLLFSNSCEKDKIDKNKRCVENYIEGCMCLEYWEPVCGCNGKTYSNEGCAGCAGITDFTMGECK